MLAVHAQPPACRLRLAEPRQLLARDLLGNVLKIPVRNERDLLDAALAKRPDERCDLARFLEHRAPRVEDSREQHLAEALGHVARRRRIEVDADRVHGQVGEPLLEQLSALPNVSQSASFGPPPSFSSASASGVEVAALRAREKRLLEHDELGVDRVDLRLQNALGRARGGDARPVRERERRRQRHETRAGQRRDVTAVQRLRAASARRSRRSAPGRSVFVSRKRVSAPVSRPSAAFDERPEDVLPAQHPVGEEVEARGLLGGDELARDPRSICSSTASGVVRPRSRSRVAWTSASDRG